MLLLGYNIIIKLQKKNRINFSFLVIKHETIERKHTNNKQSANTHHTIIRIINAGCLFVWLVLDDCMDVFLGDNDDYYDDDDGQKNKKKRTIFNNNNNSKTKQKTQGVHGLRYAASTNITYIYTQYMLIHKIL